MKYYKSSTGKFIFFILFIFLIIVSVGCSSDVENGTEIKENQNIVKEKEVFFETAEPIESKTKDIIETLPDMDEKLAKIHSLPDDYKKSPKNSYDIINEVYSQGEITREEVAKLSVFAQYDPELLPEEYKTSQPVGTCQYEIKYLCNNWDSLSQSTKDAVIPYIVPMSDPRSIFSAEYQNKNIEKVSFLDLESLFSSKAYAAEPRFMYSNLSFNHDGQLFTISYLIDQTWNDELKKKHEKMADTVSKAIIHSWDKFVPLLDVKPSSPYLIDIVDMGKKNSKTMVCGEESYKDGNYRIKINSNLFNDLDTVKSTTAHELFHSFQDEIGMGFEGTEEKWLCEATAVWSENYAYEDLNEEHTYHSGFFRTLERDRIDFDDKFEYYSYMLFYYLTDYESMEYIDDILYHAAKNGNKSIRPYLEKTISKDAYGEFALLNWNRIPVKEYFDYGDIIGSPSGKCLRKKHMDGNGEDIVTLSLEPGALKYYFYTFDQNDPKLQHVVLTFDNLLVDDEFVKRQALIKVDGEWIYEDLCDVKEKLYCKRRESQNEKVEALVLIYSNSSFESQMIDIDTFEVRTEGCPKEMEIRMRADYEYTTQNFKWTSHAKLFETLEIRDHCMYMVKNSQYTIDGEGYMDGEKLIDSSGSLGFSVENPDIHNTMCRILKNTEKNIAGAKEAYQQFGISDNIPPEGILVTLPYLEEPVGNTTIYFPDPIGAKSFSSPMPYDGFNQIGALIPKMIEWHKKGIDIERDINPFNYKCPIQKAFSMDINTVQEQLQKLKGTMSEDIPEIPDMPDIELPEGMDIGDLGNIEMGGEGKTSGANLVSKLDEFIGVMKDMSAMDGSSGGIAKVNITIEGEYTKYYED